MTRYSSPLLAHPPQSKTGRGKWSTPTGRVEVLRDGIPDRLAIRSCDPVAGDDRQAGPTRVLGKLSVLGDEQRHLSCARPVANGDRKLAAPSVDKPGIARLEDVRHKRGNGTEPLASHTRTARGVRCAGRLDQSSRRSNGEALAVAEYTVMCRLDAARCRDGARGKHHSGRHRHGGRRCHCQRFA